MLFVPVQILAVWACSGYFLAELFETPTVPTGQEYGRRISGCSCVYTSQTIHVLFVVAFSSCLLSGISMFRYRVPNCWSKHMGIQFLSSIIIYSYGLLSMGLYFYVLGHHLSNCWSKLWGGRFLSNLITVYWWFINVMPTAQHEALMVEYNNTRSKKQNSFPFNAE